MNIITNNMKNLTLNETFDEINNFKNLFDSNNFLNENSNEEKYINNDFINNFSQSLTLSNDDDELYTNNKIRLTAYNRFKDALFIKNISKNIIHEIAMSIEIAMFNKYDGVNKYYKEKYRELIFNLRDDSNPELNERIFKNIINPIQLVNMSYLELASDKLKAERAYRIKWNKLDSRVDLQNSQNITDLFKCGKCKGNKTSYYQLQTRSADEPMTTFVTCVNCNNRWKC